MFIRSMARSDKVYFFSQNGKSHKFASFKKFLPERVRMEICIESHIRLLQYIRISDHRIPHHLSLCPSITIIVQSTQEIKYV